LIVYEVGADQILHFRQLFETAKMLGWKTKEGFYHVAHGLIRWKTGKFSTRKGDTIHLSEVIETARVEARKIAEESRVVKDLSATEKKEMIDAVAIGAIKYSDLQADPKKDIIFDWDKIMSLEGDSGPYLQYAYARCKSILAKSRIKESNNWEYKKEDLGEAELSLLRQIYRLEEKVVESASRFSPAVLVEYITGIARSFNEYYAKSKIIDGENEALGVFMTQSVASVLERGMKILGIKTLSKM